MQRCVPSQEYKLLQADVISIADSLAPSDAVQQFDTARGQQTVHQTDLA